MGIIKSIVAKIPALNSYLSFGERAGINQAVGMLLSWTTSIVVIIAVYLWGHLSWPWLVICSLAVAASLMFIVERILRSIVHFHALRGVQVVDRVELAKEAETLSQQINGLVGEHYTAIQSAWQAASSPSEMQAHVSAVGKLMERYNERYAAKAWRIINDADKVLNFNRSDLWHMGHGVHSQHDITNMAQFLAKTASDLKYGPALPRDDPARSKRQF